jgi:hypothetical protein
MSLADAIKRVPMIQVPPSQVTPVLKALFDIGAPTGIRCRAVLEGGNAGKIITDVPERPRWACVWEADDGILYRDGALDRDTLQRVVSTLRQEGVVALAYREGDACVAQFPAEPNAGAPCLEFDRPAGGSDLSPCLDHVPAGCEVRRMDRALLERSPWRESNSVRYGSLDNLLDKGIIVYVLQDGEIVSEAHADMEIGGVREVGIVTKKEHRGRGLATLACAQLLRICEAAGCGAYWDCAEHNAPSVAVARKLGFGNMRKYRLLAWFKQEA